MTEIEVKPFEKKFYALSKGNRPKKNPQELEEFVKQQIIDKIRSILG